MTSRLGWLVSALFLVSGATALVYQIAWTRSLTLIFGSSHEAVSIVLGSFMAGLALGGFCLGRLCHRLKRPLRAYGVLELLIALVGLLMPLLFGWVNDGYIAFASQLGEVNWKLHAMRVALAFGLVVLPTFFMGGTLPVLVQLLVRRYGEFGVRLAWLYGVNTLGAVMGALAAGFLLLPALGVWHTQLVAIGVNAALGTLAILVDSRLIRPLPHSGTATRGPDARAVRASESVPTAPPSGASILALRLAFFGTAVCGMGALALEVMWTRAISVAAGTSTYSFTVMLAAFLVGIALGSWLHALVPLRRVGEAVLLGTLLLLIGVASGLTTQWIPHLPQLAVKLNARLYGGIPGVGSASTLLLSFAVMLLPCALLGMAFPVAGQARARLRERFGQSVGDLIGLNTLGCVAGALLAGFVFVPRFGLQRSMLMMAAIMAGYGLLVLTVATVARHPRLALAVVPSSLLLMAAAAYASLAAPPWDARLLGAFCNNLMTLYRMHGGDAGFENIVRQLHLLYYHEGTSSIVSVIDNDGTRSFIVMGKAEASDSHSDLQHERLLGHLPVLLHPQPRSAAIVGLGAGITLGGVAAHDDLERITLVEIEPGVRGVAQEFSDINGNALEDPRLKIVFQDGRNYLLTAQDKFDVITADPIHPWAAGSSYLYTAEYYRVAAERLEEGGVMCQWLPLYELSEANLRSAVATFNTAFPHVTVWQTALDAVLIGSNRPQRIDPHALERRLSAPRVAAELEPIGLGTPLAFLAELALDEAAARRFGEGAVINTDDNLYLEFSAPLSIGTPRMYDNVRMLDSLRTSPQSLLTGILPPFDTEDRVAAELADYMKAKSETVLAQLELRGVAPGNEGRVGSQVRERMRAVHARTPDYGRAGSLLALASLQVALHELAAGLFEPALGSLREAAEADPFNPNAVHQLAKTLNASGEIGPALAEYELALKLRPRNATLRHDYGEALLAAGRNTDALEQFQLAVGLRPNSAASHHALAVGLASVGQLDGAIGEFAEARRLEPATAQIYNNMARVLMYANRHAEALQTLRDGVRASPYDTNLLSNLILFHLSAPQVELRDAAEALRMAERLTRSGSSSAGSSAGPEALELLAAAQAATGNVRQGLETARRALSAAQATGDAQRISALQQRVHAMEQQVDPGSRNVQGE